MSGKDVSCVDYQHHSFRTYNDSVDVISGWETVFGVFNRHFDKYYFDRFPQETAEDIEYTPDFTVHFNNNYGIVGKILPKAMENDPSTIAEKLLNMLAECDDSYKVSDSNDTLVNTATTDFVAFVPDEYSSEFGNILNTKLSNNDPELDNNVVLIRYGMDDQRANYIFQRETSLEDEFREDALPDEESLNETIGPDGGYKSYKLGTKEFLRPKSTKPIYNTKPPHSYLATYLWMKEFPTALSEEDFAEWRKGQINKKQQVTVECSDLTNKLNTQRINDGDVKEEWIEETMDFLCTTRYAEESSQSYNVMYTGVVQDIDITGNNRLAREYRRATELALKLIKRYCKYSRDSVPSGQSSLEEFS